MSSSPLRIETKYGPILGFKDTFPTKATSSASQYLKGEIGEEVVVLKWLGVPYGKAERWARPGAPDTWVDPLECYEYGSVFVQPPGATYAIYGQAGLPLRNFMVQSEDSFSVNVFVPEDLKVGEKLPVMVYVYGGSLATGSSAGALHDPTEWMRREASAGRRFIVVNGNYRLNNFGFIASKDLEEVDPDGLAGNYGMYDVIAFMEWVQDNISNFGGDPNNVTAFGESAGAFLVSVLLAYPRRLFDKAILQSGSPTTMAVRPVEIRDSYYQAILKAADITSKTHPTAADRVAALRALPVEALHINRPVPLGSFGLTLESGANAVLTEHPAQTLKGGKIPNGHGGVIVGVNADEGSLFAYLGGLATLPGYQGFLSLFRGESQPTIKELYPPPEADLVPTPEDVQYGSGSRAIADAIFEAPMEHLADILAKIKVPLWAYRLETTIETVTSGKGLGALHSIDLAFIHNLKYMWHPGSSEERTSRSMGAAWAKFAATGIPGVDGGGEEWNRWTEEKKTSRVWKPDGSVGEMKYPPRKEGDKRSLWIPEMEAKISTTL